MKLYINDEAGLLEKDLFDVYESYALKLSECFSQGDYAAPVLSNVLRERSYVNITFVDEDTIRELNRENRDTDKVTDVLSFPMIEATDGIPSITSEPLDFEKDEEGNDILCLGDVIICPSKAFANAEEYGHSKERELLFLTAHSFLHLIGYDHLNADDEKHMILKQKRLMNDIGLAFDDEKIELDDHKDDISSLLNRNIAYPAGSLCAHCGYVAILGRPNVGKSTLINSITGMKIAIVSHRPQTTRTNIRSIYNTDDTQMIFIDTPGIHNPGSRLARIMVDNSLSTIKGSDAVLLLADARFDKPGKVEKDLLDLCRKYGRKVVLAVNKSDEVEKETLLPLISNYSGLFDFTDIIPISARTGDNIDLLLKTLSDILPEGNRLFDSEYMTDQTERMISSELIREQILHYTNQEIPHGTAVDITKFEEKYKDSSSDEYDREIVKISADIICERESHKPIIIGKDGQMIKRIGTASRKSIERLLGCKVYLDLFVKVRGDWKNNEGMLKGLGYRSEEAE